MATRKQQADGRVGGNERKPFERWRVTCAITSSRSWSTSVSVSADWIEAIRNGPCLRIGTDTG